MYTYIRTQITHPHAYIYIYILFIYSYFIHARTRTRTHMNITNTLKTLISMRYTLEKFFEECKTHVLIFSIMYNEKIDRQTISRVVVHLPLHINFLPKIYCQVKYRSDTHGTLN